MPLRKRYLTTVSKLEALRLVLEAIKPLARKEEVLVPACKGRITAGPVRALVSNPPYTCAAMDGYAVSFEKTVDADLGSPVTLARDIDAIAVNTDRKSVV
jgi:molybdopterin biosynthesis enzyme